MAPGTSGLDTTQPLHTLRDWLALPPPQPVLLSPMQIRLLLRVVLPQPVFDHAAVLRLIAYQQRHKQAAYQSHRRRRLRQALAALQRATRETLLPMGLSPPHAPSISFPQGGSVSL